MRDRQLEKLRAKRSKKVRSRQTDKRKKYDGQQISKHISYVQHGIDFS
jgi:hypothetical protein